MADPGGRSRHATECERCGYALRGLDVVENRVRCPECGLSQRSLRPRFPLPPKYFHSSLAVLFPLLWTSIPVPILIVTTKVLEEPVGLEFACAIGAGLLVVALVGITTAYSFSERALGWQGRSRGKRFGRVLKVWSALFAVSAIVTVAVRLIAL